MPSVPRRRSGPAPLPLALLVLAAAGLGQAGVLKGTLFAEDRLTLAEGACRPGETFTQPSADLRAESAQPLVRLVLGVESAVWGRAPLDASATGYRLDGVLLHALNSVLVLLALRSFLSPGLSLLAALLFALHPLHVGTTASLLGRGALLGLLGSLLAALTWWRSARSPALLPPALVLYFVALLATPLALGLPLVLGLIPGPVPRRRLWLLGLPALLWILLPIARPLALPELPLQPLRERLLVGACGWIETFVRAVVPAGGSGGALARVSPEGFSVGPVGLVALGLAAVCVGVGLVRGLASRAGGGARIVLAVAALATPPLFFLPAGATLEARAGYLAVLPLLVGAAAALLSAARLLDAPRALPRALVPAAALLGLGLLSHAEARVWRSDEAILARVFHEHPRAVLPYARTARLLRLEAEQLQERARPLAAADPERSQLLRWRDHVLGVAADRLDSLFRTTEGKDLASAWRERGLLHLALGQPADARGDLVQAVALDSRLQASGAFDTLAPRERRVLAEMFHGLGQTHSALGEREHALEAHERAVRLDPTHVGYLTAWGRSLCRAGRFEEGLGVLTQALDLAADPAQEETLVLLIAQEERAFHETVGGRLRDARAAEASGEYRRALGLYEEALGLDPGFIEGHLGAAWLKGYYFGRYPEAYDHLDRAAKVASSRGDAAARNLLEEVGRKRGALQKKEEEILQRERQELHDASPPDPGTEGPPPDSPPEEGAPTPE